jgi:hypothetical protein
LLIHAGEKGSTRMARAMQVVAFALLIAVLGLVLGARPLTAATVVGLLVAATLGAALGRFLHWALGPR